MPDVGWILWPRTVLFFRCTLVLLIAKMQDNLRFIVIGIVPRDTIQSVKLIYPLLTKIPHYIRFSSIISNYLKRSGHGV